MENGALGTRRKALALNLDATTYGTFAEIGGGQEVARWFFAAGGAAGTVAKTVSAYDMAVSHAGQVERVWCATEDGAVLSSGLGIPYVRRTDICDWRAHYPSENPTHLNTVSFDGPRTLVALHNQGILWCVEEGRVWHDARPVGAAKTHNHACLSDGRVVVNDTLHGTFFLWHGGEEVAIDVSEVGQCPARPAGLSAPWAVRHGWLRGFASLGANRVVVGQCPASLIVLDLARRAIDRVLPLHDDWRVSVNGVSLLRPG